jgi:hypothetical protein
MAGQETKTKIPYAEGERPPNSAELSLWDRAEEISKRVTVLSYVVKLQYRNMLLVAQFCATNKIQLNEPTAVTTEQRMIAALKQIEDLRPVMDGVRNMTLGVRMNQSGTDLDIITPDNSTSFGWIIPAVIGAVALIGIIARWVYLEKEIRYVHEQYNGILTRSDAKLCADPKSKTCADWQQIKKSGGYEKRESIIYSALSGLKTAATTGLSWGLAIAIGLIALRFLPSRRE